jgi:hypothetical protein
MKESNYNVLCDVPVAKVIPTNIASGNIWSSGLYFKHNHSFIEFYKKTILKGE